MENVRICLRRQGISHILCSKYIWSIDVVFAVLVEFTSQNWIFHIKVQMCQTVLCLIQSFIAFNMETLWKWTKLVEISAEHSRWHLSTCIQNCKFNVLMFCNALLKNQTNIYFSMPILWNFLGHSKLQSFHSNMLHRLNDWN